VFRIAIKSLPGHGFSLLVSSLRIDNLAASSAQSSNQMSTAVSRARAITEKFFEITVLILALAAV
jgi:hypothetical protein